MTLSGWSRFSVLRRMIVTSEPAGSFLEIGCGQGALGARLAGIFEYEAYEPDEASHRVALERIGSIGGARVVNSRLPDRPDRAFDYVGAFEVLEHIEDDLDALRRWIQWLRPGGTLVLSVPAWPERFGPSDEAVGHYRRYEPVEVSRLLRDGGYQLVDVAMYGFPWGYIGEAVRNRIVSRREPGSLDDRTAASGRWLQTPNRLGWAIRMASLPIRALQRVFSATQLGTGLIVLARRPT